MAANATLQIRQKRLILKITSEDCNFEAYVKTFNEAAWAKANLDDVINSFKVVYPGIAPTDPVELVFPPEAALYKAENNMLESLGITSLKKSATQLPTPSPVPRPTLSLGPAIIPPIPARLTVPTQPARLTIPTQPARLTIPTQPARLTVPTQPARLTIPTQPARLIVPTQPARLTIPTQPARFAVPTQPARLTVPTQPARFAVPTQTSTCTEHGSNVAPNQIMTVAEQMTPSTTIASVSRHEWTSLQTKRFIALVGERMEELNASRNKQSVWKLISDELGIASITKTKCEDKWKNLKKGYRDYCQNINRTGAAPSKFEFGREMGEIMGNDPTVKPKFTIDSEGRSEQNSGHESSDDIDMAYSTENDGNSQKRKTPTTNRGNKSKKSRGMDKVLEYLKEKNDNLLKEMKSMHDQNMAVLNKIADKL